MLVVPHIAILGFLICLCSFKLSIAVMCFTHGGGYSLTAEGADADGAGRDRSEPRRRFSWKSQYERDPASDQVFIFYASIW